MGNTTYIGPKCHLLKLCVWILGIAKFVYEELEYQMYYILKAIYLATNVLRGTDNESDKNEKILYFKTIHYCDRNIIVIYISIY